ncbi:MAG TPA: MMPL family transporter [Homoserinimonas sp.]|nr:MMPL family transporter [Homoserinimonas sp.]
MATLLYRLGRFAYRRAWLVIGAWLLALLAILGGGFALGGQLQESFEIPGTESQSALDRLESVFPQVAGASAQVVSVAPAGASVTDERYREAIEEMADEIRGIDGINSVLTPFDEYAGTAISDDDRIAKTQVQFDEGSEDVTDGQLAELTATAAIGEEAGLDIEFGGPVFQQSSFGITIVEMVGVLFAAVVLVITFGSLMAAGMPLLSALVGVGIVIGGIIGVSAFTTVSNSAPLLALMIGLAVGIDYSLFILSRHRNQLAHGEEPEESAAMAVGTAGSAVVFAGVTVIIALLGLLVVGIPFLSVMGVGAAFAVLIAIGVATTLLPALLGLAGSRLAPRKGSRGHRRALANSDDSGKPSLGRRWVRGVMKVPVLASAAVVIVLGVLAIPAASLDLNLPDNGSEAAGSTQRKAYDLITQGFGPGYNGPLIVAIDITQTTDILEDLDSIGDELDDLPNVAEVGQGIPDEGLDTAIIQVVPESAPDSVETKALVQSIRDLAPRLEAEYDTPISVTGFTAIGIDISKRLTDALIPFGLIVVGLSIVLLMMVFRSVLVPVKAALGFLLSVVASFGVVVAVFQWGWLADLIHVEQPGPILSFMPILLMAVLFGLAMDYEVFLVSGMREEYVRTGDARFAIERGFTNAARVVTAAALIMFFVFFAFVPEGAGMIKPIALGLAVGIALDAFLVRMTLVPALMTLFGRAAWWMPQWLARLLPHADVEGERLREHREAVGWAGTQYRALISTEELVAGSPAAPVGPITTAVSAGSLLLLTGEHSRRSILAATLGGRVDPVSGRAQVGGHPLPSESSRVRRMVAMTAVSGPAYDPTVGQLLDERMRLTRPRGRRGAGEVESWVRSINSALADVGTAARVEAATPMAALTALQSATVLVAAAVAEGAPVVAIDLPDDFGASDQLIMAAVLLASRRVTIIAGVPRLDSRDVNVGRPVVTINVDTVDGDAPNRDALEGVGVHSAGLHSAGLHSAGPDRREVLQ